MEREESNHGYKAQQQTWRGFQGLSNWIPSPSLEPATTSMRAPECKPDLIFSLLLGFQWHLMRVDQGPSLKMVLRELPVLGSHKRFNFRSQLYPLCLTQFFLCVSFSPQDPCPCSSHHHDGHPHPPIHSPSFRYCSHITSCESLPQSPAP